MVDIDDRFKVARSEDVEDHLSFGNITHEDRLTAVERSSNNRTVHEDRRTISETVRLEAVVCTTSSSPGCDDEWNVVIVEGLDRLEAVFMNLGHRRPKRPVEVAEHRIYLHDATRYWKHLAIDAILLA